MRAAPSVLLLSHANDPLNTGAVASSLRRRGADVLRLDTDRVLLDHTLTVDAEQAPRVDGAPLRADAAWIWRVWPPTLPDDLPAAHRRAVAAEAHALLTGAIDTLPPSAVIDPPARVAAASGKLRQLRLAAQAGLAVMPTLHTSDPDAARAFWHAQDGDVVVKLHEPLDYSMDGGRGFATRPLLREHLDATDGLRCGPMILQRRIPKAHELRIVWIDGAVFTGALDGAACGDDWRYARGHNPWLPWTLDRAAHEGLNRLMAALGLRQGTIDLIVTPAGEHVFLEVNPTGEWGMLFDALGLPIPDAIADALLRGVP